MEMNILFPTKNFQDLNPLFIGMEDCSPGHSFGPSIRSCYLIHYIRSGKGTFETGGKTYQPQKGDIFIIRPDQLTTYAADHKDPWSYIWVGFNGRLSVRLDTLDSPVVSTDGGLFIDLINAHQAGGVSAEFIASRLFILYTQLFEPKRSTNQYVRQIADYITYNYMNALSVEQIAKLINLDRRYASRLFKSEYGRTISQYIIDYRMKKAKEFLRSGYSVSQTAKMVGYGDAFNFSKIFKKTIGQSPVNFKV